jgi:hypothetical protein
MSVLETYVDGWRRLRQSPRLVLTLWALTLVVALPAAWLLRGALAAHLGDSLMAETAARGVNLDWWNEFLGQASGLGATFSPRIIGMAAVLDNLSRMTDAQGVPPALIVVVAAWLLLQVCVMGGLIERVARQQPMGRVRFLWACARHAGRLVRLALVTGAGYWVLFTQVHPWWFGDVYEAVVRDVTSERVAFAWWLAAAAVFALPVLLLNVVADYARVRAVVEDRRSVLGALVSGARFAGQARGTVAALMALQLVGFGVWLALYALVAPGASAGVWGLVVSQAYIVGRLAIRVSGLAAQVSLFQSRLAHAGYVAHPLPAWPDSAAADAILPRV